MIAVQNAVKFNGGGHINHSIFWNNLTPHGEGQPKGMCFNHPLNAECLKTIQLILWFESDLVTRIIKFSLVVYTHHHMNSIAGDLLAAIQRDFGSFDTLKTQLASKTVAIQGSGWGWLVSGVLVQIISVHGNLFFTRATTKKEEN